MFLFPPAATGFESSTSGPEWLITNQAHDSQKQLIGRLQDKGAAFCKRQVSTVRIPYGGDGAWMLQTTSDKNNSGLEVMHEGIKVRGRRRSSSSRGTRGFSNVGGTTVLFSHRVPLNTVSH